MSPYLKFGCLSSRYFYQCLQNIYKDVKKHTSPPVSLLGQLLWREFFYTTAFGTPNFDKMKGNRICKQIPWNEDHAMLAAWRDGKTGYPWIDAIMVQLLKWGWMHHLARHCVACFLTRGDLFIHWEQGRDVFERLLIDSDWAINNGNWMWLSCSSFFYQFNRIYSPISFGKKYDPDGKYIRHFLPVLKGN
jgi:cryptochrome